MRIIYLHQYFTFPSSSGGTRSYDLAKKFVENGYAVEFITTSTNMKEDFKDTWNFLESEKIKFHILNLDYNNSLSYFKRVLVFWKFLWFASFKILKLKGDLVIATSTPLTIGIPALVKKLFQKTPYIFEVRDVWPEAVIAIGAIKNKFIKKILYGLESLIYKNASAIIPLSTDMKASIVGRYKKLTCPIIVIENISELNRFKKVHNYKNSILKKKIGYIPRFSILYAGTFGKVNGIDYVIDFATKLLPIDSTINFILIGRGAEKEEIQAYAKKVGVLNKNVFILDPVSKMELPLFYSETSMGSSFVIPIKELWANSANKFFDTLAAGKPILINHEGWQKEIILENNVGFILPWDRNQINDTFLKDFVDFTKDTQLNKLQQKNSLKLASKFSLEQASMKYIEVINTIFNSP